MGAFADQTTIVCAHPLSYLDVSAASMDSRAGRAGADMTRRRGTPKTYESEGMEWTASTGATGARDETTDITGRRCDERQRTDPRAGHL